MDEQIRINKEILRQLGVSEREIEYIEILKRGK